MSKPIFTYGAMSGDFQAPGDRRRFSGFASRHDLVVHHLGPETKRADVVVLTLGSDISRWKYLKRVNGKLVLDIVDSYLDESLFSPRKNLRGIYKSLNGQISIPHVRYTELIKNAVKNADLVICASVEQQKRLSNYNHNVHAIGDCFDEIISTEFEPRTETAEVNLLWEGMPDNLRHLELLSTALTGAKLTVLTSPVIRKNRLFGRSAQTEKSLERLGTSCSVVPWTIPNLKDFAKSCTLAVIPISSKNRLAWRKSENKLLGLWSLGMPVLVSPTPSYSRILQEASLSRCLVNDSDWRRKIVQISSNRDALNEIAMRGYYFAKDRTSSATLDPLWKKSFASIGIYL